MALRIYNTRTRRKEPFTVDGGRVRMYVCGPTTYDYSHVGHARSYIAFDVVRRYLEFLGYDVVHVQNFTDVEDVITKRAREAGMDPKDYAETYIRAYLEDMAALNVKPTTVYPKVSEHIPEILACVRGLVDRGYGYPVDGDVYFRTRKAKHSFGLLSHRRVEDIVVEPLPPGSKKEDPLDFAIWKRSAPEDPGWASEWGRGRPGWHVECFAMASKYLGPTVDIHGGGTDLKFPHHESEAMICEGYCGTEWARWWMHNGFVTMSYEKMSKSLGNFITIRSVLRDWSGDVVRLCFLKDGYRSDVEYDASGFSRSNEELGDITDAIDRATRAAGPSSRGAAAALVDRARKRFFAAMDDDFDAPEAFRATLEFTEGVRELRSMDPDEGRAVLAFFHDVARIFGVPAHLAR